MYAKNAQGLYILNAYLKLNEFKRKTKNKIWCLLWN